MAEYISSKVGLDFHPDWISTLLLLIGYFCYSCYLLCQVTFLYQIYSVILKKETSQFCKYKPVQKEIQEEKEKRK